MPHKFPPFAGAALVALLLASSAAGQGSLAPPGAPAPTQRSLQQVEPRVPVSTLPGDASAAVLITQPGSYYLSGNVTAGPGQAGIAIVANLVTLDLNGFAITGNAGSTYGIELRGSRFQIAIENGIVRTFDSGGIFASTTPSNLRVERMSVSQISAGGGIVVLGVGSANLLVRGCQVSDFAAPGGIVFNSARGSVDFCTVTAGTSATDAFGIQAQTVTSCEVSGLGGSAGNLTGIAAPSINGCTVNGLTLSGSGTCIGLNGSVVSNCSVLSVTGGSGQANGISGLGSVSNCQVASVNCSGAGTSGGIAASTAVGCRVTGVNNTSGTGGAFGISASSVSHCHVTVIGNSTSTVIPVGISSSVVSNCTATVVGNAAAPTGATAISGAAVENCSVSTITGGSTGSVQGISAPSGSVRGCQVSSISLLSGTGVCLGINAEVISNCRVSNASSGASGNLAGYNGYRLLRDSTVTTLSATGTGLAFGAVTTLVGRTENLEVNAAVDTGISVSSSHVIAGCSVGLASTNGILVTGNRCVVEGNNIVGNTTNGIVIASGSNTAHALVVRNQIRNCGNNIVADAPAQVAPIVNTSGIFAAATNALANFTD